MVIWLVTIWETQALLSLRQQPGQTRGLSRPRTIGSSGVGARHKILLYCSLGRLQILIPRAFMIRDGVSVCTSPVSLLRSMHAFGKGAWASVWTLLQKISRKVAV